MTLSMSSGSPVTFTYAGRFSRHSSRIGSAHGRHDRLPGLYGAWQPSAVSTALGHLGARRPIFVGPCPDHRHLHHMLEHVECVEVIRQAIVLDYPAVLGLIWRHNTLGVVDGALGEVSRLATA